MVFGPHNKIDLGSRGQGKEVCVQEAKYSVVKQVVFNSKKFVFCKFARLRFLQSSVHHVLGKMDAMRAELDQMLKLKLGFYASVCHRDWQKSIVQKRRVIKIKTSFCTSLFGRFRDYLLWKNRALAAYARRFHNYLSCFGTDGSKRIRYPFHLSSKRSSRLARLTKRCVEPHGATLPQCLRLCTKFSIFGFSRVFDGDRRLFSRLYNFALSTIRLYNFRFKAKPDIKPQVVKKGKPRALKEKKVADRNLAEKT